MIKPDSRFTFEKGKCPFKANLIPDECDGNNCEIWMVEQDQGKDLGCSMRIQAESTRDIAQHARAIAKFLLQILGHLKTNK